MTGPLVALGGGLGAATRFLLDSWVARHNRTGFPLGTIVINVTGSFLLGLLTGWVLAGGGAGPLAAAAGVGFLGGYTTFSTATVEAVRLHRTGRHRVAVLHAGGMLVIAIVAATVGLWIAQLGWGR